jgi:alpha-L-arabinofuranosidase
MNFVAGQDYDLSFYARTEPGAHVPLQVSLESASGHENYATKALVLSGDWQQYRVRLRALRSDARGRLSLRVAGSGTVWFDVVSLFPRNTYKGRANGLRPDLVGVLDDLHPAFMRFPGGAVTGGLNLDDRFQWKHSIGDIARRRGMFDLWGYYSTNGLGFHEYLQLIEDLGGVALYVCNPGFSDNYRHAEYAPPDKIADFVQEALDALEYALGPLESRWGAERARNGHAAPFPLKYVEIGNETSGTIYPENYRQFYRAIKAKYPQLTVIAADAVANAPVDMVDRHEFGASAKLYEDWTLFDTLPRSGPAYYVGEFSVDRGSGEGDLESALAEAAFRLGLERNSDLVRMSSYAPLLANTQDNAWPVNMIHFDSSRVAPRTSYFVQKMFVANRPDQTLLTTIDPRPVPSKGPVYALGGWDRTHREIVLKIVNRSGKPQPVTIEMKSLPALAGPVGVTTLSSDDPTAENSVDDPTLVVPVVSRETVHGGTVPRLLPANSLTVLRFATTMGSPHLP